MKEEDYTGRYFINGDHKIKVIGYRNKIVEHNFSYDYPWLIYKEYKGLYIPDVFSTNMIREMTETDSNCVPLKNRVITKTGLYKTRDGRRAFVYYYDEDEDAPWKGCVEGYYPLQWFYNNGHTSASEQYPDDIIGPWEDE